MTVVIAGEPVRLPKGSTLLHVAAVVTYRDADGKPCTLDVGRKVA